MEFVLKIYYWNEWKFQLGSKNTVCYLFPLKSIVPQRELTLNKGRLITNIKVYLLLLPLDTMQKYLFIQNLPFRNKIFH